MKNNANQHSLQLRLDWSEMDLFGHINNVAFFKYIQASRVNFWEDIGLNQLYEENRIGPMLAQTCCQFKKPLFYPGHITLFASVSSVKTSSFTLQHQIWNEVEEVVATGEDVVVVFDFEKNSKVAIPQDVKERID